VSELWPLFLLRPFPLPHECVRKVRSVQKSREVIYHLRMIAPCAVKAIRFNACIHAAPKSFAYFVYFLFFFSMYVTSYAMHLYYVDFRNHQCREFSSISPRSLRTFDTLLRHFVTEFTGLRCSITRHVYHST